MSGGQGGGNKVRAFLHTRDNSGTLSLFPEHSFIHSFIHQQIFVEHFFITRIYRQNCIETYSRVGSVSSS